MKTKSQLPRFIALALLAAIVLVLTRGSASAAERVGTYDSRLVAFAAFWDDVHQARLKDLAGEARAAKEQGDDARYQSLAKELSALQDELHMQVFSTAPIDRVLAGLKDRLPEVQREAGVSRLVSQWDDAALAGVPAADRVDVTDRLVREFKVPDSKLKQLGQMKTVKPLPLWRARLMSGLHLL
jgi:hypothetical protein